MVTIWCVLLGNECAGVNMSLLSKVMSPRLSMGVFNCGLLSTEAGTLARALADGLISVVGRGGQANLLNFTMIPTLSIVVYTTIYTWVGYYTLYWLFSSCTTFQIGGGASQPLGEAGLSVKTSIHRIAIASLSQFWSSIFFTSFYKSQAIFVPTNKFLIVGSAHPFLFVLQSQCGLHLGGPLKI